MCFSVAGSEVGARRSRMTFFPSLLCAAQASGPLFTFYLFSALSGPNRTGRLADDCLIASSFPDFC